MKCAIVLMCVAAASGLTVMPLSSMTHRKTVFSLNTGMPMAFLRKKRDVNDDSKKSVAIHVRNPAFTTFPRFAAYSNIASPYIFRKKRDVDQKADSSALFYSPYSALGYSGLGYSSLGYSNIGYSNIASPFIFRKKRDVDQKADSSALFYSPYSALGYS